jgi:hypothetical protein
MNKLNLREFENKTITSSQELQPVANIFEMLETFYADATI